MASTVTLPEVYGVQFPTTVYTGDPTASLLWTTADIQTTVQTNAATYGSALATVGTDDDGSYTIDLNADRRANRYNAIYLREKALQEVKGSKGWRVTFDIVWTRSYLQEDFHLCWQYGNAKLYIYCSAYQNGPDPFIHRLIYEAPNQEKYLLSELKETRMVLADGQSYKVTFELAYHTAKSEYPRLTFNITPNDPDALWDVTLFHTPFMFEEIARPMFYTRGYIILNYSIPPTTSYGFFNQNGSVMNISNLKYESLDFVDSLVVYSAMSGSGTTASYTQPGLVKITTDSTTNDNAFVPTSTVTKAIDTRITNMKWTPLTSDATRVYAPTGTKVGIGLSDAEVTAATADLTVKTFSATTYNNLPSASTIAKGVVQLVDTYPPTSTSTTDAPTVNALRQVYTLANGKLSSVPAATTTTSGGVIIDTSYPPVSSTTKVPTTSALLSVYNLANGKLSSVPTASTTVSGTVTLDNTYPPTSISQTTAPTTNALKQVYDLANGKLSSIPAATTTTSGGVIIDTSYPPISSTTKVPTTSALLSVYNLANGKLSSVPTASTTVSGTIMLDNTYPPTSISQTTAPTSNALKQVYDLANSKLSSQWTTSGSDIYYTAGRIGIGTIAPNTNSVLHVNGGAYFQKNDSWIGFGASNENYIRGNTYMATGATHKIAIGSGATIDSTAVVNVAGTIKATGWSGLPTASTITQGIVQLDDTFPPTTTSTTTAPTVNAIRQLCNSLASNFMSSNSSGVAGAWNVGGTLTASSITCPAGIALTNGDPGDMISKIYNPTTPGDRYGIGQYSGGVLRLFISNALSGATFRISRPTDLVTTGGATFTDLVTVDYNGNMGIGVTPSYKVHAVDTRSDWVARFRNVTGISASEAYVSHGDGHGVAIVTSPPSANINTTYALSCYTSINNVTNSLLYVRNDGCVGVGTFSPGAKLDVAHAHVTNYTARITNTIGVNSGQVYMCLADSTGIFITTRGDTNTPSTFAFNSTYTYDNGLGFTSTRSLFNVKNNGFCGIGNTAPVYELDCGATNTSSRFRVGAVIQTSDSRLKNVLGVLTDNVEKVKAITPYAYTSKTDRNPDDPEVRFGFLAQEVEEVFPELVDQPEGEEYKNLNYIEMIPVLLGCIKELTTRVEVLEACKRVRV